MQSDSPIQAAGFPVVIVIAVVALVVAGLGPLVMPHEPTAVLVPTTTSTTP